MSMPFSAPVYTQGFGSSPSRPRIIANVNPGTTWSPSFYIGLEWINESTNSIYILTSISTSGGVTTPAWTLLESGSSSFTSLTGDSGGSIFPLAGNINLHGGTLDTFVGSGNTLTLTPKSNGYPISPYIVGSSGQAGYQTIQSAVNAANAAGGGTIWVQPGSYNENLTLYGNVEIVGSTGFSDTGTGINITGVHTPPMTGGFCFRNVKLISSTHIFSSTAAGSAHLVLGDAAIAVTNGYTYNLPNWTGILESYDINCGYGTNDGFINNNGGSLVLVFSCGAGVGTGNTAIISGTVFTDAAEFFCPVNFVTGATPNIDVAIFFSTVTLSNNSTGYFSNTSFYSGSSPSITMSSSGNWQISNCVIKSSNNPAISGSGAGTLSLSGITFVNNANVAGTLTLSISGASIFAEVRAGTDTGGASAYTSLTNTNSSTISTGTGTVKMSSGNNANNSAWIKIYIGTTAYWIPAWTTNSP